MSAVPTTPTTALTLDEINPASFDFWLRDDVEGALAKLRHERPVAWHQHPDSGKGFWSVTRFDDVAAATRDWETFSSSYGIQVMTDPEDMQYMGAIRSMISTDPPKHTKLRGVVNRGFTPKMIAKAEGEAMPPEDLGPFFLLLIAAGNETTRTAISQGMWAFTQFPHEKRKWQADLDGLSASAVEEIIRWASPVMHMRRTVTRDTLFAGVQMQRKQ